MVVRSTLRLSAVAAAVLLATTLPAAAQLVQPHSGGASALPACPDSASNPTDIPTPCAALVSFRGNLTASARAGVIRGTGASIRSNFRSINGAAVVIPHEGAYWALAGHPDVERVIPDRPVQAFAKPSKPGGGTGSGQAVPEGVKRIGAGPGALGVTGAGVGVAIADTGLDLNHADLNVAAACFDAFDGDCSDGHGHGTHVGGIVAALNNTSDVVGVAPAATLYAVRVLDNSGSGSDSGIIEGLAWILEEPVDPPIRVVNMSLGRPGTLDDNPLLRQAVQNLASAGVVVVVASRNSAGSEVSQTVPATYPEVMAVASTTAKDGTNACRFLSGPIKADTASYFTTDGRFDPVTEIGVTISAPGETQENVSRGCMIGSVGIQSLKAGGGTTNMSGTSMAAPHVAGVVALIKQNCPGAGLDAVRSATRTSADNNSAPLDSPTSGYSYDGEREGIVDAGSAVSLACPGS